MITKKEMKIYGALFDVMKKNMDEAGAETPAYREAFLACVHTPRHSVDMTRLAGLSRPAFMQAAYGTMLQRFPDENARKVWKDQEVLSDYEFKKKLVKVLKDSREIHGKQTVLWNDMFSEHENVEINTVMRTGYSGLDRLYSLYSHMPEWMKRFAKRVLR